LQHKRFEARAGSACCGAWTSSDGFQLEAAEAAAQGPGLEVHQMHVSTPEDLGPAFASLREQHVDAVVMMQGAMFRLNTNHIVALARATKVPVISGETGFAAAGGLMNYGASIPENWHRMAVYADKILKGAKPEDLPVEQPAKYELVVNVQAARAIGIELPPAVLVCADEVIE
jgi:putative tryptophan/tyrosine transport system substrate-binding protein